MSKDVVTFNVFFNGNPSSRNTHTIANLLNSLVASDDNSSTRSIDGISSGEGFNLAAHLFGRGIDKQVADLQNEIIALSKAQAGKKIIVNAYGVDKGAITALLMALAFQNIPSSQIEFNLTLVNPIPGNSLLMAHLDFFKIGWANKLMDLRNCMQIKNVLMLYSTEPKKSLFIGSAVLRPMFHESTRVTEEVMPGGFLSEFYSNNDAFDNRSIDKSSFLRFVRAYQFMGEHGTTFASDKFEKMSIRNLNYANGEDLFSTQYVDLNHLNTQALECYKQLSTPITKDQTITTHSIDGNVLRFQKDQPYYNTHHQIVSQKEPNKDTVNATVVPSNNIFAKINRFALNHSFIWKTLRNTTLLLATTGLLVLLLHPATWATVGIIAAITATAEATGLLVWSQVIKPYLKAKVSSFFYPHLKVLKDTDLLPDAPTNDSTESMINQLGGAGVEQTEELDLTTTSDVVETSTVAPLQENELTEVKGAPSFV